MTPSQTICYCSSREGACGRPLDLCSDCAGWLRANSVRIANAWAWTVNHPRVHVDFGGEAAELNDLGVYMARRFLA